MRRIYRPTTKSKRPQQCSSAPRQVSDSWNSIWNISYIKKISSNITDGKEQQNKVSGKIGASLHEARIIISFIYSKYNQRKERKGKKMMSLVEKL